MPRTQAERRATTRKALLDAAAELFAERGVQAVSLDQIAARAGLTRGALNYNFDGKADLLAHLLEDRLNARSAPADPAAALSFDRQSAVLFLEFAGAAARDPAFGAKLLDRLSALRAATLPAVLSALDDRGGDIGRASELVHVIGTFVSGLRIEALAGADPAELDRRLRLFLDLITD